MSAKRWAFLVLSLGGLTGLSGAAQAGDSGQAEDLGQACAYHRPRLTQTPADRPQFKRVTDVIINGVRMPAYSLSLTDGGRRAGAFATYQPDAKFISIRLKPKSAASFVVFAMPWGTILVPRGWKPRVGALGADGSYYIIFAPDASNRSYLSISNTSACVGCAYSSASWYFRRARALARKNGYAYCRSTKGIHSVRINRVQRAYRIKTAVGNPVDGLAYFNPDDDLMFYEVEISAPASKHALASAVLNQFVVPGRSK